MSKTDSNVVSLRSHTSEAEVVDEEKFTHLVNTYSETLRRNLRRFITLQDDIEDAIQETFIRVLQRGQFIELENPGAFLFRTARNILIDRYRKRRLEKTANNYQSGTYADSRGEVYLDYSEMTIAYQQALSELPRKCRQVFLMRRYDGVTNSEIAEILGISTRMVQKHMIKALTHFNSSLR